MFEIIEKLTEVYGVSGEEEDIRAAIINEVKDFVDELWVDSIGNLIVKKNGCKDKKVVLTTNMDTRGIMITQIMNNGLLKFIPIGSQSRNDLHGQVVKFKSKVEGIVIAEKNLETGGFSGEIYIDIDSESKEESERVINIGDTAMVSSEFKLMKNRIRSGVLENRAICGMFISLLKGIKDLQFNVYFVFTAQGISSLRSIDGPIAKIKPDIMIHVDAIPINVVRNLKNSINKGPILNIIDSEVFSSPRLVNMLREIAQRENIDIQNRLDINKRSKTVIENREFNSVMNTRISIPCQNLGSVFETMSVKDIEETKRLLESFISES